MAHRRSTQSVSERSPALCVPSLLPGKLLPPGDDHVAVLRLQFDQACLTPGLLARDQRRAGAAERIEHGIAALAAVPDGALNQLDRLHRRVQFVHDRLLHEPDVTLVAGAAPEMIRAFLPPVK